MPAPTAAPLPKVPAAGGDGLIATVLIAVAKQLGLDLPEEVAAGIVAVVAFAAGYLKKDKAQPKPKLFADEH